MICPPPRSTLFPYTTLFRSSIPTSETRRKMSMTSPLSSSTSSTSASPLELERLTYPERGKRPELTDIDRKSTRLNSSHVRISYAVFCLKKKKNKKSTSITKQ